MKLLPLVLGAVLVSGSAQATVVLSDNFNSENGGATALNYSGFANFNVTGQVDLVGMPNGYGITCSVACVDLDGSTGPGAITSKQTFAFAAGDTVDLSFVLGGAQRGSAGDYFYVQLLFNGATPVTNAVGSGYIAPVICTACSLGQIFTVGDPNLPGAAPFITSSLSFTAVNAGSLQFTIGTQSADNVGPLLDAVSLDIGTTSVPEPATLSLLGLGLAAVGLMRRRKVA
jgi:hypothetical protein